MNPILPSIIAARLQQATNSALRTLHAPVAKQGSSTDEAASGDDHDILSPITVSLFIRVTLCVLILVTAVWLAIKITEAPSSQPKQSAPKQAKP